MEMSRRHEKEPRASILIELVLFQMNAILPLVPLPQQGSHLSNGSLCGRHVDPAAGSKLLGRHSLGIGAVRLPAGLCVNWHHVCRSKLHLALGVLDAHSGGKLLVIVDEVHPR